MRSLRTLIEHQIAKARIAGQFSGPEGEGNPLPDRPLETSDLAAVSAGRWIMAGVIPEAFALKKVLATA